MANVWKLRSMAASFAMQEGGGSEDFLDRLNLMRRMQARESGAALEPDAKSVQIMTIHKSKGLEFPAVFYRINSINRLLTGSAFSIFPALVLAL